MDQLQNRVLTLEMQVDILNETLSHVLYYLGKSADRLDYHGRSEHPMLALVTGLEKMQANMKKRVDAPDQIG